jgi:raffinose/stachyose/melibiose transport system substrate-binding protein
MKKRILSMLLALSVAVTLSACSGNKSADSGNSASADKGSTANNSSNSNSANEKVKFSLWHSFVGADQKAAFMETKMKEFREEHPNYEIDEQKIPRDQYQTKLKTQAAAGQLPDAFVSWPNAMTKEFSQAGLLTDINDLLAKKPEWKEGFVNRALEEFTFNGKTYSAGIGISITSLVFYNKTLFDKYGLSYPKSYEELKNVIKVFNDNGVIPIAHGNKPRWPMQSSILSMIANRETGSEWLYNVLNKQGAKFTDPEFIKALKDIKELVDIGAFNKDYTSIDNVQMRDYFYKGEAAMMIDGSWAIPDIIAKAPEELKKNIEIDILPPFEGGKGDPNVVSGVSGTGIVINAKVSPKQKSAIEELIVHVTDSDAQKLYAKYNIAVSYKNIEMDPNEIDPIYAKMVNVISKHPLVTVYDSALNSEQTDIVNNGLQAITIGQKTPEQVAEELQAAVK